ncbi:MAG: MBL fold metallo-hydrolase [Bacilli bacterium]
MNIFVLASGSKGNATAIEISPNQYILLDQGLSLSYLLSCLRKCNIDINNITHYFFTHRHGDHVLGIDNIDPNKIYSLKGTLDLPLYNYLSPYYTYDFKTFKVTPFLTSHDAPCSCGYSFIINGESFFYITDTGVIPQETIAIMHDKNYYLIEANHDCDMVLSSNRPEALKLRIIGDAGHLSNKQCVNYLNMVVGPNTKEIILAHVSEQCNSDKKIYEAIDNSFIYKDKVKILIAKQWFVVKG